MSGITLHLFFKYKCVLCSVLQIWSELVLGTVIPRYIPTGYIFSCHIAFLSQISHQAFMFVRSLSTIRPEMLSWQLPMLHLCSWCCPWGTRNFFSNVTCLICSQRRHRHTRHLARCLWLSPLNLYRFLQTTVWFLLSWVCSLSFYLC